MATRDAADIYRYATTAGFSTTEKHRGEIEAVVATAVALAESGGNPSAHNKVPPDDSYGLWQINMIGGLGPERRKKYGLARNTDLFNPDTNARVAYGVFKDAGRRFTPWSVYTSGSYLRKLNEARAAAGEEPSDVDLSDVGDTVGDAVAGIGDLVDFISNGENWKRVAFFIAGGIALILGLFMLVKSETDPLKAAARIAGQ